MLLARLLFIGLFLFTTTSWSAEKITIGSGSLAGTYYPFAVSISDLANRMLNVEADVMSGTGSKRNNEEYLKATINLAMMQNDIAFYAYEGLEKIPTNKKLRAIGSLYNEDYHIITRRQSGIRTLSDMAGKRISLEKNYFNYKGILEAAGVFTKIQKDFSKHKDAIIKLKKGEIDGLFYTVGWPSKGIMELTRSANVNFVPIEDKTRTKSINSYPFMVKSFIPSGVYNNLDENIQTLGVKAMLTCSADLPNPLVYAITKLIYENLDTLQKTHPKWESVNLMAARDGIAIPFHPGAEAYFMDNTVGVRAKPYLTAPIIGYVKRGAKLKFYRDRWNMYLVQMENGAKGWVPKSDVIDVQESEIQGLVVNVSSLNFRRMPSLRNFPIGILRQGEQVEKIGEQLNEPEKITWYRIIRENGAQGWASGRYLTPKTYPGFSGRIKPIIEKSDFLIKAEQTWVKAENWSDGGKVDGILRKIEKLQGVFTAVDLEVLNEKLDYYELKKNLPSTSGRSFSERISIQEQHLDGAVSDSIRNYLNELSIRHGVM